MFRSDGVLDDVILRLRKHFSRDDKRGRGIEQVCWMMRKKRISLINSNLVLQIFGDIDRDNDGMVDVYEFQHALEKIGMLSVDLSIYVTCRVNV